MDAIPFFSQVKSAVQAICGDKDGARRTQMNFLKQCPVVSQATSYVQWVAGDSEGARETQKQFGHAMGGLVNSVPVVGHAKGAIHYICGDEEGGHEAMKASSRSVGVVAGGVGGFLAGGPVGAVAGGIYGGTAADTVITGAELIANGDKAKPYGVVGGIVKVVENPKDSGAYVDLIGGVVMDGLAGYAAGEGLGKKIEYKIKKNRLDKVVGKESASHLVDAGESMKKIHSKHKIKSNKPHIHTVTKDKVTGKTYQGHNQQIRQAIGNKKYMTTGPTELQKRVTGPRQAMKRNPNTCAEQQAYNGAYKNRPDARPSDFRSATVRMDKNKGPVSVRGCDNCHLSSPAMGEMVTNRLPDNFPIPGRVSAGRVAGYAAAAVVAHGLSQHGEDEDGLEEEEEDDDGEECEEEEDDYDDYEDDGEAWEEDDDVDNDDDEEDDSEEEDDDDDEEKDDEDYDNDDEEDEEEDDQDVVDDDDDYEEDDEEDDDDEDDGEEEDEEEEDDEDDDDSDDDDDYGEESEEENDVDYEDQNDDDEEEEDDDEEE